MKSKINSQVRFFNLLLSVIIFVSFIFGNTLYAQAADDGVVVKTNTFFNVPNYKFPNNQNPTYTITSIGGISAELSGKELYVLKGKAILVSNDTETNQLAALYYYPDITKGNSGVKKILFRKKLLGHANAMAIDKTFIYVTTWPTNKLSNGQTQIVRISRKAIREWNESTHVTSPSATSPNGTTLFGYMNIYNNSDGSQYTKTIKSIAGYKYNSSTQKIKSFIINYGDEANGKIPYTTAEISSATTKTIYVMNDNNHIFKVNNPYTNGINNNGYIHTVQDIGYNATYGLYIPIYLKPSNNSSGQHNRILRLSNAKLNTTGDARQNLSADTKLKVDNSSLDQYEVESIAFTNKTINGTTGLKMLLSVNRYSSTNSSIKDDVQYTTTLS